MYIAVCEDNKSELLKTKELLEKWIQTASTESTIAYFESGNALIEAINKGDKFDLYLLDVLMPGLDGIKTGEMLRSINDTGEIIYLSSSKDYAAYSYDVNAFYYLLKPVSEAKLFEILDKANDKLSLKKNASIIVQTESGNRNILLENILYVERVGRRAQYFCISETIKSNTLRGSFKEEAAALLEHKQFYMCGASFVLNLRRVSLVNNQTAQLSGGVKLTLPRASASDFKKAWGEYWLEEGNV